MPTTAKRVRVALITGIAAILVAGTAVGLAVTGASAAIGPEAPTQLRVNEITSPMAVPATSPWLSWVTQDSRQGESQSAYEVRVATSPGGATSGRAVWDSGKVAGSAPWAAYHGPALASGTRYWWSVRTWDAETPAQVVGPWAVAAEFGTALGSSWSARPIWSPPAGGKTSGWAFLRGTVGVANKPVVAATAYATGLSTAPTHQYVFRLSVNGRVLGDGPALPTPNAVEYQAWDVTSYLRPGSRDTFGALAYTTADQRFELEVVVEYADGTRLVWGTGSGWQALDGGSVYPAAGSTGTAYYTLPVEDLNAGKYPFGFDTPGFSARGWSAPVVKAAITGLTPLPTANMTLVQNHPVKVTQLPGTGHYLIDFGTTQLGGLHLYLTGTAGRKVTIRYGEVLASPTSVQYHLSAGNVYQDTYTLKNGVQSLDVWGYRTFRYVEVINTPQAMTVSTTTDDDLVYPDQPSLSSMTTSNPYLNEVWAFTKSSIDALNLDPYVDSPTRERGVYTGDNYIHQLSQAAVSGDTAEGLYSLQDGLADMALRPPQASITEYELLAPVAALDSWYQSGDYQALSGMYTYLQDMLEPVGSDGLVTLPVSWLIRNNAQFAGPDARAGQPSLDIPLSTATPASGVSNGLRPAGVPTTLIDWPGSERDGFVFTGNVKDTVVNAFAYAAYKAMAQIAARLGHTSDAGTYSGYAARLQSAIDSKMYNSTTGAFYDGLNSSDTPIRHESMDTTVYVLAMGAASHAEARSGAAFLASHGITAPTSTAPGACSVYCAAYYLKALYDSGQAQEAQAALDTMTSDSETSWRHMIDLGAGSTMEAWDPSIKGNLSYSHAWATGPDFVVPQDLFGISPLTPGWGTILIAPQPGNLTSGAFTEPTARGEVTESFTQTAGGGISVQVTIPTTATAQVALPGVQPGQTVHVDGQPVTASALTPSTQSSPSPLAIQDGATVAAVPVSSGTHTITTS